MDNGVAPSRAAHTVTWSQGVIKNKSVVNTELELPKKYTAKRTPRRLPGSSRHRLTNRTLVNEPTSASTTTSTCHPCPSRTSPPERHSVASYPELPSQLLSHGPAKSKSPNLIPGLLKNSVLAQDISFNSAKSSQTQCTAGILLMDSQCLNMNPLVDKQNRHGNQKSPGPPLIINAASEVSQGSTSGETTASCAALLQHVDHAAFSGDKHSALDKSCRLTGKPLNIGNPRGSEELHPSNPRVSSGLPPSSCIGEALNHMSPTSSNLRDKSQNRRTSTIARNPHLQENSPVVDETANHVVQPNSASVSQVLRVFDSAAFDVSIYQQQGAAPPPPGVLHTPLIHTQKRACSISKGGRLYIHSNPAIHTMHNRSDAWYARKAMDIHERRGRKFWFGKVAKRLRWLQEGLDYARNRPTREGGRRLDPQPRTYTRPLDFADVPESELPEDVRQNSEWLKACEWFRGNRSHSQSMKAARLREFKRYEQETNNLYMSLKQDIPDWSQRLKDFI